MYFEQFCFPDSFRYILFGCRKTIKLNEEPNTIKTHASAHCLVVNF
ncbi:hypothetical protein HanIR_Chr11g0529331 [Helianthus annuus]|nr:hypothetical protein HanIR_Chr11g0529331 [Helianthus annuus]